MDSQITLMMKRTTKLIQFTHPKIKLKRGNNIYNLNVESLPCSSHWNVLLTGNLHRNATINGNYIFCNLLSVQCWYFIPVILRMDFHFRSDKLLILQIKSNGASSPGLDRLDSSVLCSFSFLICNLTCRNGEFYIPKNKKPELSNESV